MSSDEEQEPQWSADVRARLELHSASASVVQTLGDLAVSNPEAAVAFVALQPGAGVTVLVAEPGLLHRIRGEWDAPYARSIDPDTEESTCQYEIFKITAQSSFRLLVTQASGDDDDDEVIREWRFSVDDDDFTLKWPPPEGMDSKADDPSAFARHVMGLIADAQRRVALP